MPGEMVAPALRGKAVGAAIPVADPLRAKHLRLTPETLVCHFVRWLRS